MGDIVQFFEIAGEVIESGGDLALVALAYFMYKLDRRVFRLEILTQSQKRKIEYVEQNI